MKRFFSMVLAAGLFVPALAARADEEATEAPKDGRPEPLQLLRLGELEVNLRGMLQFQGAVVGSQSLLDNGDSADASGFRVRRARLGVEGQLIEDLEFGLELTLVDQEDFGDRDAGLAPGSVLEEAFLSWQPIEYVGLTVGTAKLPFSKGQLDSSRDLLLIDRSAAVEGMVPDRRLGLSLQGSFWGGRIGYSGGIYNSTPGFFRGANFGGITLDKCDDTQQVCEDFSGLVAARIEIAPLGVLPAGQSDFQREDPLVLVGGGVFYDAAASGKELAAAADISFRWMGITLMGEFLWSNRELLEEPTGEPLTPTNLEKNGWYVQAGYMLDPEWVWGMGLELAFRFERYDDYHSGQWEDEGDLQLITGGLNVYLLDGHLKFQLNYIRKMELFGPEVENDAVLGQAQWRF